MIDARSPRRTRTLDLPGTRVYCLDGADGPLALYDAANDAAWVATREPCDLREWR